MQKEVAKNIIDMMTTHMKELNDSVKFVQDNCSPEELKAYRRGVGYILSEMTERVMDSIYREHPLLLPEGIGYDPGPGATLAEKGSR